MAKRTLHQAKQIQSPHYNSKNPKHRRYRQILSIYDQLRSMKKSLAIFEEELHSLFEGIDTFDTNGELND